MGDVVAEVMEHQVLDRKSFYQQAFTNLGLRNTILRGLKMRFGSRDAMLLSSKSLDYPVRIRRNSTDLYVFDTIFVEREYSCLDGLADVLTVIDAGANCGYSSAYFLSHFPRSRVIAIEPDASNFRLMERNLKPWHDRAVCLKAALWSHNTTLQFEADSLCEGNEWGRRTEERADSPDQFIPAIAMPTLMFQQGIRSVDILKVDIEGAERALFSGDTSWLGRVRNIVIELHGKDCEAAIDTAMRNYKFERGVSGELSVYRDIQPR